MEVFETEFQELVMQMTLVWMEGRESFVYTYCENSRGVQERKRYESHQNGQGMLVYAICFNLTVVESQRQERNDEA